jgi:hypothetical protein
MTAKRFTVATDPLTPDKEKALSEALKDVAWWHWLPNFWLVHDPNAKYTAMAIRDTIRRIDATVRCLVVEVEPVTWAALTRKDAQGRDMAAWIRTRWDAK